MTEHDAHRLFINDARPSSNPSYLVNMTLGVLLLMVASTIGYRGLDIYIYMATYIYRERGDRERERGKKKNAHTHTHTHKKKN